MEGGHNYLCCRESANSISKSVFNELTKAIYRLGVKELFDIVPTQGHITCKNGYQILFSGLDDVEKVKSITPKTGVITDIWIEEATEIAQEDVKQLRKRLRGIAEYQGKTVAKRIILTFNPIYKTHWIFQNYFLPAGWTDGQKKYTDDRVHILKTTHLDNKFLDADDHWQLENEPDPYWHSVYTLGDWGVLGDAIITNWRTADLTGMSFENVRNGLDFGFASDPNAYTKFNLNTQTKQIHVFKGWQANDLTNPQIAEKLRPDVYGEPVFCDSADPKSIKELHDLGIDARPVKKGHGSVLHGIQWLQQYEIIVDSSLQHLINELSTWAWKKDKDGNNLPIPSDKNNHSIDSIRYGAEIDMTLNRERAWDLS